MVFIDVIGIVILFVFVCLIVVAIGVPLAAAGNFILGLLGHPIGTSQERTATATSGRPIPARLRRAVLKRDNYACVICGKQEDLVIHHEVMRSEGGATKKDNLVTLCYHCHTTKGVH